MIGFLQEARKDEYKVVVGTSFAGGHPKTTYPIRKVASLGEEEVFDITVDNSSHSYWTEGCNVSNCAEITLPDGGICCLSDIYLNNISSKEELFDCARLLYKTQKAVCTLEYLHEKTNKVVHRDYRIGVGVTGICQSLDKLAWLDECYKRLRAFDVKWSRKCKLPESIKLTTCKPSGSVSLLAGSTPGIHPAFAKYYIRRVRMSAIDPLIAVCREHNYPVEYERKLDGEINDKTMIVSFPCYAGENVIVAKDMTAVQQLELVKKLQTVWADNAVSVTIYFKSEELNDIKTWLKENYKDSIKSVSFVLHKEHGFAQAPYEEITKEKYEELCSQLKPFNTKEVTLDSNKELSMDDCSTGACPIR
jgi:ribonucleoside-triphosphate reductase (thioredoxin)